MQAERNKRLIPIIVTAAVLLAAFAVMFVLWRMNVIRHAKYPPSRFGIEQYTSAYDEDGDGIDDQTDILSSARAYLATKPQYKSAYYDGGYPDDGYGVCTDVVAQAMLGAGYDLMELVDADIAAHPGDYAIEKADKNIDFRRVVNLIVYFRHTAEELTTDFSAIAEWQGGDIVVFPHHIAVVSDMRNYKGVPFILHHGYEGQTEYEEDMLGTLEIIGHFRVK